MAEKNDDRTVAMRPEDLPDPDATRMATPGPDPDATRAAVTRVADRVPVVDEPTTAMPSQRDGIDAISDPYLSPVDPADLTTAHQVVSIESPVESLPERRRRFPRWAIALIIVLVVAAAAATAYLTWEHELWGGRTIPEVVGLAEEDARTRLESAGFAVEVEYRAGDGDFGTVLSCNPDEGTRVDPAEVTLVVAGERVIPDVVGLAEEDALQALYDAGASDVLVSKKSSDEPSGTVLEVEPAEGSPFVSTDQITLSVATPFVVPELEGMTGDEALARLEEAGLSGSVTYVDSKAEKNTVVESDPAAGEEVPGDTEVVLSVSSPFPESPESLLDYFDAKPEQLSEYLADEGFEVRYSGIYVSGGNARAVYVNDAGDVLQISDEPESGHNEGSSDGDVLARGAGVGGVRYAFSTKSLPEGGATEGEKGVEAVMKACGFEGLLDSCTQEDVKLPDDVEVPEDAHFICATGAQDGYTWVVRIGGVGDATGVVALVAPTSHFSAIDLKPYGGGVCDYVAYIDLFTG